MEKDNEEADEGKERNCSAMDKGNEESGERKERAALLWRR